MLWSDGWGKGAVGGVAEVEWENKTWETRETSRDREIQGRMAGNRQTEKKDWQPNIKNGCSLWCSLFKQSLKPVFITTAELLEPFCWIAALLLLWAVYGLSSFGNAATDPCRPNDTFYSRRRSLLKRRAQRGQHDGDQWSKTLDFRLIIKNYSWSLKCWLFIRWIGKAFIVFTVYCNCGAATDFTPELTWLHNATYD